MMSLTEMKKSFDEANERECKQGTKSALLGIGCSFGLGVILYLYGQCVLKTGRHLGRMDVLNTLSKAADELNSIEEVINKN